jgi:hypothetical protein
MPDTIADAAAKASLSRAVRRDPPALFRLCSASSLSQQGRQTTSSHQTNGVWSSLIAMSQLQQNSISCPVCATQSYSNPQALVFALSASAPACFPTSLRNPSYNIHYLDNHWNCWPIFAATAPLRLRSVKLGGPFRPTRRG